jgi:hypothetical protein
MKDSEFYLSTFPKGNGIHLINKPLIGAPSNFLCIFIRTTGLDTTSHKQLDPVIL